MPEIIREEIEYPKPGIPRWFVIAVSAVILIVMGVIFYFVADSQEAELTVEEATGLVNVTDIHVGGLGTTGSAKIEVTTESGETVKYTVHIRDVTGALVSGQYYHIVFTQASGVYYWHIKSAELITPEE